MAVLTGFRTKAGRERMNEATTEYIKVFPLPSPNFYLFSGPTESHLAGTTVNFYVHIIMTSRLLVAWLSMLYVFDFHFVLHSLLSSYIIIS